MNLMNCSVSLNTVVAWIAWSLALVGLMVDLVHPMSALTAAVLMLSAAGATLHVLGAIRRLESREIQAFELGRDSVRSIR